LQREISARLFARKSRSSLDSDGYGNRKSARMYALINVQNEAWTQNECSPAQQIWRGQNES
jgi:hypothetical protein